jgi:uncharacterized protein YjdB
MKTRYLQILLLAVAVGTFVGCGGGDKPITPPTDPTLNSIVVTPANNKMTVGGSSPQQYTASGSYSNGSTKDLTAGVTWSSSNSYVATVSTAGVVTVTAAGTATISAKSGSVTGSTNLTARALTSIAITPSGATLAVGSGSLQLTATGTFNDSTSEDVTSIAIWSSSNPSAANVDSAGKINSGNTAGYSRIDAAYLSVTGSTAVSVTDQHFSDASLNGPYVLTLIGADDRGPNWFNALITADGNGQLSGKADANNAAAVSTDVAVTGTYHLELDGRGTLELTPNSVFTHRTFRIVLSADGQRAELVSFDGGSVLTGALEKQTGSPFSPASINGRYVFALGGIDELSSPLAGIGLFQADGAGHIVSALADFNDNGTIVPFGTLTGSYTMSADGRGSLALDVDGVMAALKFYIYLVSPGEARILEIDTDSSRPATAGHAEVQIVPTGGFGSTLFDAYVFELNESGAEGRFGLAGEVVFGPSGILGGWHDTTGAQEEVTQGSYTLAANGRGTVDETTFIRCCASGNRSFVFYAVSTSRMYLLEIDNGIVRNGIAELQPGWPDVGRISALSGTYRTTTANLTQGSEFVQIGRLKADGTGGFTGITAVNAAGVLSSAALDGAIDSNDPSTSNVGRWTATIGGDRYVVYILSADKAVLVKTVPASGGYLVQE